MAGSAVAGEGEGERMEDGEALGLFFCPLIWVASCGDETTPSSLLCATPQVMAGQTRDLP